VSETKQDPVKRRAFNGYTMYKLPGFERSELYFLPPNFSRDYNSENESHINGWVG
jgi:hypothetical protein